MSTNNSINTPQITLGGTFTMSGAFTFTGTLTANTSVTFPTSGTLATTGQALAKVNVTGASQAMASNTLYTVNDSGSLVTFTLPATATIGDVIMIVGSSTSGWKVTYTTSQAIVVGTSTSTTTTGNIASTQASDCIILVCTTTNNIWTSFGLQGNITVA